MKSKTKRVGCIGLAAAIILGATLPAYAASDYSSKDEIIYVTLAHNGDVDAVYVVNSFDTSAAGTITDRGAYSEVINLTTTDPIQLNGDTVTVHAPGGKFYYEGVLETRDVPWDLSVRYRLNGTEIDGANLAGQSGSLQIDIGIRQKEEADAVWRDHYAIQVALSLDSEHCANLEAPDATIATVGSQKQLSYIILPGKDREFTITADVTEFELSGISFNMLPLSLSIDDPDTAEIKDKLYELQDGAVELDDGANELDEGAVDLLDGAERLDEGADDLGDGVNRLQDGVAELNDGVSELRDGARDLRDGADDLLGGSRDIKSGTGELVSGIGKLESGTAAFAQGLAQLNGQSAALTSGSAQVKAGLEQLSQAVAGIDTTQIGIMQDQAAQLKSASQDYLDGLDALIAMYESQLGQLQSLRFAESLPENSLDISRETVPETIPAPWGEEPAEPELNSPPALEQENTAEEMPPEEQEDIEISGEDAEPTSMQEEGDGTMLRQASADFVAIQAWSHSPASVSPLSTYSADVDAQIALLEDMLATLRGLRASYVQINGGVSQMTDTIATQTTALPQLVGGVQLLSEQYAGLDLGINAYTEGVSQLQNSFTEITGGIYSLSTGISKLDGGAGELLDGVRELSGGTRDLQDGVRKLSDGAAELGDGVVELRDGAAELKDGTVELRDGVIELKDGTTELVDGTSELREKTADMDTEVDDKIDELMEEYRSTNFTPVSFIDASNPNISAVQFVMKTAEISIEDPVEEPAEEEAEPTLWQRFANLFAFSKKDGE